MPDFIEPGLLVPIVIIVVLVIVIFSAGYRKAPPDKAFIISGLRRKAKVVIGKATGQTAVLRALRRAGACPDVR